MWIISHLPQGRLQTKVKTDLIRYNQSYSQYVVYFKCAKLPWCLQHYLPSGQCADPLKAITLHSLNKHQSPASTNAFSMEAWRLILGQLIGSFPSICNQYKQIVSFHSDCNISSMKVLSEGSQRRLSLAPYRSTSTPQAKIGLMHISFSDTLSIKDRAIL